MKPRFLEEIEETFAVRKHVILTLNTEDRFHFPENQVGPANLNYFLAQYFSRQGYRIVQYAPSMGVRELSPDGEGTPAMQELSSQNDPIEIFNRLNRLLRNPQERWIVLILHGERIAPSQGSGGAHRQDSIAFGEILHTLGMDDAIASSPSRIVLVTYSALPEDLLVRSRGYRTIDVDLPNMEERRAFIDFLERLAGEGEKDFGKREPGLDPEGLSRLTAGMPLSSIEELYRTAAHFGNPIRKEQVRVSKARAIRNLAHDLLEVSEPQEGFEGVAGLKTIKAYFLNLIPQIRAGRAGVPQAFLLQGVPGVGKSHLVKALSKEVGWPLLEMRNVRNPYVGQSEMNLEYVIKVIEQYPQSILFFDEIDQILGQRGTGVSGDSGTSERLLARIFSWLGSLHLRGRVIFIGATNRPDLLDAALLDRFGVSIPFLKPGKEEIQELVPILLKRFNRQIIGLDEKTILAAIQQLSLTGRDIQEILIAAGLRADREAQKMGAQIQGHHLSLAARDHICREDLVDMEFMTLVSLSLCSSQSLLPWNDYDGLRQGSEIPKNLIESGIVDEKGRLNLSNLHREISLVRRNRYSQRAMR
ncbi:MAG: ATP-binding protein [Deltaproteobacteria bacterium]|nr:ATP-binding protein [Deltaproteobacteria bacterium]MBM4321915.1 ATP-binding protein [Deltaproteobacteria bacterium]